jgi:DNA transformation protein
LGDVTTRKMFGGMCLYQSGIVFALQSSSGALYLKTKDPETLFGETTEQFHNMPYYLLPDAALDDPEQACALATQALAQLT